MRPTVLRVDGMYRFVGSQSKASAGLLLGIGVVELEKAQSRHALRYLTHAQSLFDFAADDANQLIAADIACADQLGSNHELHQHVGVR